MLLSDHLRAVYGQDISANGVLSLEQYGALELGRCDRTCFRVFRFGDQD